MYRSSPLLAGRIAGAGLFLACVDLGRDAIECQAAVRWTVALGSVGQILGLRRCAAYFGSPAGLSPGTSLRLGRLLA